MRTEVKKATEIAPGIKAMVEKTDALRRKFEASYQTARVLDRLNQAVYDDKIRGLEISVLTRSRVGGGSGSVINISTLTTEAKKAILDIIVEDYRKTTLRVFSELEKFKEET